MFDLFVDETGSTPTCSPPSARSEQRGRWDDRAADAGGSGRGGTDRRARTGGRRRPPRAGGGRGPRRWRRRRRLRRGGGRPGGGRDAGPRSSSALDRDGLLPGDHLHLQPGRLRRPPSASCWPRGIRLIPEREGDRHPAPRRGAGPAAWPTRTSAVLGYWDFVDGLSPRVRRPPRRHAADVPRDRRGAVHRRAGSGPSSPPRRWPSASTCRPAPSCSRSWSSSTARPTSTSRPPSTPSSPGGPAGAASTSRATPSCCGSRGVDPLAVAGLASTRTYPLRSSFRPTYNMAVNLVRAGRPRDGPRDPRDVVRPVPGRPGRRRHRDARCGATRRRWRATPRRCTATSATSASTPRSATRSATLEKEGVKARSASPSRRGGGVASRRCASATSSASRPAGAPGYAVVVQPQRAAAGASPPSPAVVTEDQQLRRLTLVDVPTPVEPVTHVQACPSTSTPQAPKSRRDLAATRCGSPCRTTRRRAGGPGRRARRRVRARSSELRRQLQAHPCHQCPDREDHARWAERWWRLQARDRRPAAQGRRPHQLGGHDLRPDLRRCSTSMGYLGRRRHRRSPRGASGCAGSTPRRTCSPPSACATACGSGSTPPGSPPPSRRWSTSRAARRPRSRPRMPNDDVAEALRPG